MVPVEKGETKPTVTWLEVVFLEGGSDSESHVPQAHLQAVEEAAGRSTATFLKGAHAQDSSWHVACEVMGQLGWTALSAAAQWLLL